MESVLSERTILVAEEDPYALFFVSEQVQKAFPQLSVRSVNSSEAALRFIDEHGQVAALLTSFEQPGISGLELAIALRARGFAAPIVITGAKTAISDVERIGAVDRWVFSNRTEDAVTALHELLDDSPRLLSPVWLN